MASSHLIDSRWRTHWNTWWPAYAALVGACLLRLGLLFSTDLVPQTDGAYYLAQVRSIMEGKGKLRFSDVPLLFLVQALATHVLLFITSLDMARATIMGVKLVDALIPPLAVLPVYALWLRWVPNERRTKIKAITVAFLPALSFCSVKMTGDLQKNAFALMFFSLAMWAFDTACRRGRKLDWLLTILSLLGCALSHMGVFAAVLTFILPALAFRLFTGALDRRARVRIAIWLAALVGMTIGLLYALSCFIPKFGTLIAAFSSPWKLFMGENTFTRLAMGLGNDNAADTIAVLLAYMPLVAVIASWRRQTKDRATAATLFGASVATVVLGFPFLGGIDGLRLHLMAYLPAAVLFASLTGIPRPVAIKTACGAMLLSNILATLPLISQASLPTIAEPSYSELLSLQSRIDQSRHTVIVARHGLEWWAAWALTADVVPTIGATPELWSKYDTVLLLQETKVRDDTSMPGRRGSPADKFRQGTPPVAGARLIYEGEWYRLSQADEPMELGKEFEGERLSGAAPRPDPLRR